MKFSKLCIALTIFLSACNSTTSAPMPTATLAPTLEPATATVLPAITPAPATPTGELTPQSGISMPLEGNQFSEVEIHLGSAEFTQNPELSQKDLGDMMKYLISLMEQGKLRQFAPGAMKLGEPNGLVMGSSADSSGGLQLSDAHWDGMLDVTRKSFQDGKWKDQDLRPLVPTGFRAAEGGEWAPQIWELKGGGYSGWWYRVPAAWDKTFGSPVASLKRWTDNDPMYTGGKALTVPLVVTDVKTCNANVGDDPSLAGYCEELVANWESRFAEVQKMLETGTVPEEVVNGQIFYIPIARRVVPAK